MGYDLKRPIRGFWLTPVIGEIDCLGGDLELSAEPLDERFGPFQLAVCRANCFSIGYDTDSNGLIGSIPGSSGDAGPLSLPPFGGLYLSVEAADTVAYTEVAVDVFGISDAFEAGEIFDVACLGLAVIDFDGIPAVWGLGGLTDNDFVDGIEAVVVCETEGSGSGSVVSQCHQGDCSEGH